jgi:glycosyltransferase involved in cell wall biosynthesis
MERLRQKARQTEKATAQPAKAPDRSYPPVSCICPTYGRVALLEEAVHSFLRQDYPGEKELIIVNDTPAQTLEFDHPHVHIINFPRRLHSIGEKYKAAVGLCTHSLIFVWHDDEIYLPHRLSHSVHRLWQIAPKLNPDRRKMYLRPDMVWQWQDGRPGGPVQAARSGSSCYTRELLAAVRGYAHIDQDYDLELEARFKEHYPAAVTLYSATPEEVHTIYRGGETGPEAEQETLPRGNITLNPQWRADYSRLVLAFHQGEPAEPPPPLQTIKPPEPLPEAVVNSLFSPTTDVKISVVLPALNESFFLQRTVEQFQATLPDNCEIIVVDNGSTDGCADFMAENSDSDALRLIRTGIPLGVAGARNKGLEYARGEVVVFADAHIDLPERWWQPIVATLKQDNVGVVGPAVGIMGADQPPTGYGMGMPQPDMKVEWLEQQEDTAYPVPLVCGCFMAIRRDTLAAAGSFDDRMPQWGTEDVELCLRYWLRGYEAWVVPEVSILHYFQPEKSHKIASPEVVHNLLRTAFLHYNGARVARVIAAVKNHLNFDEALARLLNSDFQQRQAELKAARIRDDDWFFERFKDSCVV